MIDFNKHIIYADLKTKITIGQFINLFDMNDKSEVMIYACDTDYEEIILFRGRVDYLQYTYEGYCHPLCQCVIYSMDIPYKDIPTIRVELTDSEVQKILDKYSMYIS